MMGLVVFTFIFAYGADSTASGPGLIFISLVTLFAKLGIVGNVMAVAFFCIALVCWHYERSFDDRAFLLIIWLGN